jgi:hypothetical protein
MAAFEIGISLTGTVSAGAYTAGVVDFLLQALEEWHKAKKADQDRFGTDYSKWRVPSHEVTIRGLSGASGGGVMTGLILNNIGKDFKPVTQPTTTATGNDFFDAWVLNLGIEQLLSTEDLAQNQIKALLNARAIPNIADRTLQKSNFGSTYKRPYIDPHLFTLVTVANLAGIPTEITFANTPDLTSVYYKHTDYQMIELLQDGNQQYEEAFLLPIDIHNTGFDNGYAQLKALCLCTCAFPAAFKAQPLTTLISTYKLRNSGNAWDRFPGDSYSFLCADGGIFNTEPFQLLHDKLLRKGDNPKNPTDPDHLFRAIISVAPLELFDPINTKPDITKDNLKQSLLPVLSSLREDAVMTDEQIQLAFDENYYSRYIITPTRSSSATANDRQTPAICATTLGAFGAFLSQDFRLHDYFLGRRNAQQFLRRHFAIPLSSLANNEIFKTEAPFAVTTLKPFVFKDSATNEDFFPVIPLCGTAADDQFFPAWPTGKGYDMNNIKNLLDTRADKLLSMTQDAFGLSWLEKIAANLIRNKAKKLIVDFLIKQIQGALTEAKL